MTKRLLKALTREPLDVPPVWIMRQAGRYLPEYRKLRERFDFQTAVSTPDVAAEITLQPIRRFSMDGAVIFADIMTPLEAMGVEMTFAPGPKLEPHTLRQIVELGELDVERVSFVMETIKKVKNAVPDDTAVIGFAGGPVTLMAYLLEGGGSKEHMALRGALREDPVLGAEAIGVMQRAMNAYLAAQVAAGADVVQLFDSWAGVFDRQTYRDLVVPGAKGSLADLDAPTIYFAPGAGHTLDLQAEIGATGYGVDWRIPLVEAWDQLGEPAIQGNLDAAVLLADRATIQREVRSMLDSVAGRSGHVVNLGHGINRHTPPENVAVFVDAVREA